MPRLVAMKMLRTSDGQRLITNKSITLLHLRAENNEEERREPRVSHRDKGIEIVTQSAS